MKMSDLFVWLVVALAAVWLVYYFWKKISAFLRIAANEGDELVQSIEDIKQDVKNRLK
jgi:hypothetical protein